MRLYQFLRASHALDDLQRQRLKISRLHELNDPFELLAADLRDKAMRRAFEATRAGLVERFGVLCFSRGWRNPVMWSHYADRHRGVCLGFDVPTGKFSPMNYDAKRLPDVLPKLLTGTAQAQENMMLRLLTTKFRDWKYEDEVRVFSVLDDVDPATGFYFSAFGDDLILRTVILGPRFEGRVGDVADRCRGRYDSVKIFRARLAFRTYNIVEMRGSAVVV
jgi:hypothetical protein